MFSVVSCAFNTLGVVACTDFTPCILYSVRIAYSRLYRLHHTRTLRLRAFTDYPISSLCTVCSHAAQSAAPASPGSGQRPASSEGPSAPEARGRSADDRDSAVRSAARELPALRALPAHCPLGRLWATSPGPEACRALSGDRSPPADRAGRPRPVCEHCVQACGVTCVGCVCGPVRGL
jgi:hypothetical protein